ncbi:MAG: hypothetical protein Q9174_001890 [Haloplaca sp. 1 TL-2023]
MDTSQALYGIPRNFSSAAEASGISTGEIGDPASDRTGFVVVANMALSTEYAYLLVDRIHYVVHRSQRAVKYRQRLESYHQSSSKSVWSLGPSLIGRVLRTRPNTQTETSSFSMAEKEGRTNDERSMEVLVMGMGRSGTTCEAPSADCPVLF